MATNPTTIFRLFEIIGGLGLNKKLYMHKFSFYLSYMYVQVQSWASGYLSYLL